MAENKKSVLFYCDIIHTVDKLTDEEAGKLFKHYLRYINDMNPTSDDRLTNLLFEPIKQNLKRDLKKWESIISKRSEAGLASAEKRKQIKQMSTCVESVQQTSTNPTVIDTVNVTVKDIVKENSIDSRKLKFADTLKPFLLKYGKEMIRAFYDYWTEPNKSNSKFKQELQKTWSLERRLETWSGNETNFKPKKQLTYHHDNNGII